MGLIDGILGNVSEVKPGQIQEEFSQLFSENENVEHSYKLIRDLLLFTNTRLILVNKQGLTGKKIQYHSIPYNKVTHFSIETTGHFDMEAELIIWVTGMAQPIRKAFNKKVNIYDVQRVLASYLA